MDAQVETTLRTWKRKRENGGDNNVKQMKRPHITYKQTFGVQIPKLTPINSYQ